MFLYLIYIAEVVVNFQSINRPVNYYQSRSISIFIDSNIVGGVANRVVSFYGSCNNPLCLLVQVMGTGQPCLQP